MELQRDTSERVGEEREGEGEGGQVGVMNRGEKRGKQERRVGEKGRRVERRGRGKRLRTFIYFFFTGKKDHSRNDQSQTLFGYSVDCKG